MSSSAGFPPEPDGTWGSAAGASASTSSSAWLARSMPSELLDLARTIALEAGELAAQRRREGVEVAATKSTIVDVVTEADREVERLIRGAHPRGATRRLPFWAKRADSAKTTARVWHERPHLGRRSDRRHRQLPVRHPALRGQHRGGRRRARSAHLDRPAWMRAQPRRRRTVHRLAGRGRVPVRRRRAGRADPRRSSSSPRARTHQHRVRLRARRPGRSRARS